MNINDDEIAYALELGYFFERENSRKRWHTLGGFCTETSFNKIVNEVDDIFLWTHGIKNVINDYITYEQQFENCFIYKLRFIRQRRIMKYPGDSLKVEHNLDYAKRMISYIDNYKKLY